MVSQSIHGREFDADLYLADAQASVTLCCRLGYTLGLSLPLAWLTWSALVWLDEAEWLSTK